MTSSDLLLRHFAVAFLAVDFFSSTFHVTHLFWFLSYQIIPFQSLFFRYNFIFVIFHLITPCINGIPCHQDETQSP